MKKNLYIIFLILCVSSANAQWYRAGGRAGNRMANYAQSMKMFSIQQNARYNTYKSHISYSDSNLDKDPTSFMDYFVAFGFGIGGGTINPTGNLSHGSFDMDLIVMNVLFSYKAGTFEDTSYGYDISSSDADSWQLGVLIPITGFGGEDWIGRKHKCQIYIAPLIGFIDSEDTVFDGSFMHENTLYHNCSWWISDNKETDTSCTEYGGALMVRYGCGYLLGKFTNKSVGLSIGFCI